MSPLFEYTDFIARNTEPQKSQARPFVVYALPTSIGQAATERNRVYASASVWAEAQRRWFLVLEDQQTKAAAKRHAKFVMSAMRRHSDLGRAAPDLPELCEKVGGRHGNASNQVFTLYSQTGATATGTRSQLAAATGLAYERVRDLTTERRRIALGWALTEEEAQRGYLPPGKPPKAPEPKEFFVSNGTDFF